MSAEANIQNAQYKPQMVDRPAAANETKYVDRGDIDRRLPYLSIGMKMPLTLLWDPGVGSGVVTRPSTIEFNMTWCHS